jgi:hypothetical protein
MAQFTIEIPDQLLPALVVEFGVTYLKTLIRAQRRGWYEPSDFGGSEAG